jgi:predicted ATPase/DNA-binding SARP family transcriptional activator
VLALGVLGPIELHRDGERVPLRAGKTTEVLIRLALEAGTLVRTERLIDDLWADEAPTTARNTLQQKVKHLRRSLGDDARVVGSAVGYTLEIDPSAVDALTVGAMAERAAEQRRGGDAAGAVASSGQALALFRGDVLLDAGDGEWVVPHRVRLEELRAGLVEDHLGARLDLGDIGDVIPELESLVAAHPLREGLWSLLMTAQYRGGRQADALATYTRVRVLLADELGLDPGPALQDLEQRILLQDPALLGSPRGVSTGNLPLVSSRLIGRDDDVAEVRRLVRDCRLVTLIGMAGVGKTRVALEVAREERGAWMIRLDTASDAASVLSAVADALGLVRASEAAVVDRLRGAEGVLVFDSCEHVADDVAALLARLLASAPRLTVLCTSQAVLGVEGETTYPLEPLGADASAELFVSRAGDHRRAVDLADTSVRDLCAALDGLPLAIELAAARTKTLSVDEISRRLDDRFTLLRDPSSRRPPRQRALATALAWSYDLLFPDDQRGLWALSVFVGGAPLAAYESVLAALGVSGGDAIDVLSRLADRSLLYTDVAGDGSVRFRLLDSVRALAGDRVREAGQLDVARRAHARWFAGAGREADGNVRGPAQPIHLELARVERANIDAAITWCAGHDPRLGVEIAMGFAWAWVVLGIGPLGTDRLRAAVAAAGDVVDDATRAEADFHLAWLESGNDVSIAEVDARRGLATADALGDAHLSARLRVVLAFVLVQQGRGGDALPLLAAARTVFRASGAAWEEGTAWVLTVHAASPAGEVALAERACREADELLRSVGDDWALVHLDAALGHVAAARGEHGVATAHLRHASEAAHRLGYAATEGYHLATLGRVLYDAGDDALAIIELRRAIDVGREARELRLVALARAHLGAALARSGDVAGARDEASAADHWFRSAGGGQGADVASAVLAAVGTT